MAISSVLWSNMENINYEGAASDIMFPNYIIWSIGIIINKKTNKPLSFSESMGYKRVFLWKNNKAKTFLLHSYLYRLFNNSFHLKGHSVDHIDGNKRNNSTQNLRQIPQRLNTLNPNNNYRKSKTGYTGVTFYKGRSKPYCVIVKYNKKSKNLGYYKTGEEASKVYKEWKQEVFNKEMKEYETNKQKKICYRL